MAKTNTQNSENNKRNGSKRPQMPDIRRMPKRNGGMGFSIRVIIGVVIALVIFGAFTLLSGIESKGEEVSLSRIVKDIEEGSYEKIILQEGYVILELEEKQDGVNKREHALLSSNTDFYERLDDAEIDITDIENDFYEPELGITAGDIISIILLSAGLILVFMMVRSMQASGGKLMDFGQSKARLIFGKKTGIKFDDVAGIEDVKEEVAEIVDFLKSPRKYLNIGARIPKGVLLVGAPGTGKTLLAKAVAGEASVPFFHTSGSEFEEMLVGAGASRVRDLFKKAKKAAPCIIFIDEIDAVAKKRGTVLHAGATEQTLNQILVEMDGLESNQNVIVLAATNRPDVLDPAILRPGRFDRSVTVQMPDFDGRLAILGVHARGKKFEEGVSLEQIAKKTIGYSGADLENLLNEAAIAAAKDGRKTIKQEDLLEAYLKVKLGRQRKNRVVEDDLKRVAYHEAGHAVVAKMTPEADSVEQVSIVSRGSTGGVTVYLPDDDRMLVKQGRLEASIRAGVGGKVAEEVFFGDMSTGASGDIRKVTEIARSMVQKYGMSKKLGFVKYGNLDEENYLGYQYGGEKDYSEKTAEAIDEEVKRIVDEAQADARRILEENKEVVERLVELLLEKEEVGRAEFEALF